MQVHVVQYRYQDGDYDGFDVVGVYANKDNARNVMKDHMDRVLVRVSEYYPDDCFSDDFKVDWPDMIQFGFYGHGFDCDHIWSCSIETTELE